MTICDTYQSSSKINLLNLENSACELYDQYFRAEEFEDVDMELMKALEYFVHCFNNGHVEK